MYIVRANYLSISISKSNKPREYKYYQRGINIVYFLNLYYLNSNYILACTC